MSVTLRANDSINLTTGVVTRNTQSREDALNKLSSPRARILWDSQKRAYRNDLNALAYVIRNGGTR